MAYTTIDDPSLYFQTLLYTGNSSSSRSLTNTGNSDLQPDWLWVKNRTNGAEHGIWDSTRGAGKRLLIGTDAQEDQTNVASFNSDGFTVNTGDIINTNSHNYVAWQWKANGGSLTTASESGSNVGYSRQVNTTSGFAIIKYTGIGSVAAVIHGMGATPSFFTVKRLSGSGYSWYTYHHKNTLYPWTDNLYLNNNDGTTDSDTVWDDQAPNSTEIKIGTNSGVNSDNVEYIMYAFAEKKGFSKFGSYKGNGNADGPFVFLGFKPEWILFKRTNGGRQNWFILDNKRDDGINPRNSYLMPNQDSVEDANNSTVDTDFLSNGFKLRATTNAMNANGDEYVYVAFASHPFVSSEGVPTTAE